MKRVLLTGMSGTGKSTLITALAARGYRAVDIDHPDWCHYRDDGEWVWREDRVADLLADEGAGDDADDGDLLFVSGCAINQGQFYPRFSHVVLLTAPTDVIVERIATRTTNEFGKDREEMRKILQDIEETVPLLRRRATHEVDTSAPLDEVVDEVLRIAEAEPRATP